MCLLPPSPPPVTQPPPTNPSPPVITQPIPTIPAPPPVTLPAPPAPPPPPIGSVGHIQTPADAQAFVETNLVRNLSSLAAFMLTDGKGPLPPGINEVKSLGFVQLLKRSPPPGLLIQTFEDRNGNLVVETRGTEPGLLRNWLANAGFIARTDTMAEYVKASTAYLLKVQDAVKDTGKPIIVSGFSLGGGLSQMLGKASGLDAIGFNAPTIIEAYVLYKNELAPLVAFNAANLKVDDANLVNIRGQNDNFVSGAVNVLQTGKQIVIRTPPAGTIATESPSTIATLVAKWGVTTSAAIGLSQLYAHEIRTLEGQIKNNAPIVSYTAGGTSFVQNLTAYTIADLERVVSLPATTARDLAGVVTGKIFKQSVVNGNPPFFDPPFASGYIFSIGPGDPRFTSVGLLPQLDASQGPYTIELFQDGSWTFLGNADPLTEFLFPFGGVEQFKVSGFSDLGSLEGLLVQLSFASDGEFTGTISLEPTPEPMTLLLWGTTMAGLGLATRWRRRRRSNSNAIIP